MRIHNQESALVRCLRLIAVGILAVALSSCETLRIERKAEELRRSGVARDMAEARRMAENYYWAEADQQRHEARRENTEIFPLKRDAKK